MAIRDQLARQLGSLNPGDPRNGERITFGNGLFTYARKGTCGDVYLSPRNSRA
jgi:hypothetical protein